MNNKIKIISVILLLAIALILGIARNVSKASEEEIILVSEDEDAETVEKTEEQYLEKNIDSETDKETSPDNKQEEILEPEIIYVHVCGEVASPGIYELKAGDRVYKAIEAAGGFSDNANENYLNLAQGLLDGVKLYVPSVDEEVTESVYEIGTAYDTGMTYETGSTSVGGATGLVNINTASMDELMTLTGVGESKAKSIINYRNENGSFSKPEDIMNIPGIKDGLYNKIKDSICTN